MASSIPYITFVYESRRLTVMGYLNPSGVSTITGASNLVSAPSVLPAAATGAPSLGGGEDLAGTAVVPWLLSCR